MSTFGRRAAALALSALLPLACGGEERPVPTAADLVDDLDVRLLDVEHVALVSGLPDDPTDLPEETEAALDALEERLERDGFRPLMRRGARPRPRVEVVARLRAEERGNALEQARRAGADLALFLSLHRLEVLDLQPPADSRPGRVESIAAGEVRLTRLGGAPLDARTGFESRSRALLDPEDLRPELGPRTAVARRVGAGLLDTLRLGAAWTRVRPTEGR